ncbi:PLP-dependent aminotransferase family protein [Balneolaceae bacterium ANBcel3]|nr:PLP-dependent aminotransferase family protein [Balneolaceae bacterium ANBcel3]
MNQIFSDRISDVPKSFIREILSTTLHKDVISFAGGLPNRNFFPVEQIKEASQRVLDQYGADVLQYSMSEGHLQLREWIAKRYKEKMNLDVHPDQVLITSGSQQGLDLVGKILINERDHVAIEEPGYLGAIQAFSIYRPTFEPVPMHFEGLDTDVLKEVIQGKRIKVLYTVPSFQNPSGISHTDENRDEVAKIVSSRQTILVEDNPYGELCFTEKTHKSYYTRIPDQTVLFGSFSKTFVPSFRIGWLVAPKELYDKLLIAKQASDLHTNYYAQCVLYQYLCDNNMDEHISAIREKYFNQKEAMIRSIQKHFPEEVQYSNPDGGMFLWAILPEGISAHKVFHEAIKHHVAFVPGDPFYVDKKDINTMRLNFSCVDEPTIEKGISTLGKILKKYVAEEKAF